jgi:TatD DNase family protein
MTHHYIDAGINLTSSQFDGDREDIIMRANNAGISNMLLIGCDLNDSRASLKLAQAYHCVSTVGIHPHNVKDAPQDFTAQISKLLDHQEIVAIGECGLDFNRDFSPRDVQQAVLKKHLKLSEESKYPVYLHERDAFPAMKRQLENVAVKGVLHCFTGNREALEFYLDYGLYIGITGWVCDERRGAELQSLVPLIPDDKLLLETDAPYLLPRSLSPKPKSRRNESMYLSEVANTVSQLRGQTIEHIAQLSVDNFNRLFLSEKKK